MIEVKETQNEVEQVINYCVERIAQLQQRPALVAVVGESGSGKSFFTKRLQEALLQQGIECSFLNHDDFLIPRKDREALREHIYQEGEFQGKTHWEVLENWYYLDEFQRVINALKANQPATYYAYERSTGDMSQQPRTIEPQRIVLLENKLFLDQMDLVINLQVDRDTIIKRKIERDSDVRTPEQTIEMHEKAQGYFWDRNRPKTAHISIDNNNFHHPKILTT